MSSNLVQESLLGVFPNSCVTQHLSLLNNHYDTGQDDIQQKNTLHLLIHVPEYLKVIETTRIIIYPVHHNYRKILSLNIIQ